MAGIKKSKGSTIKSIIVAIFLVALVLFYFNYLNNRSTKEKDKRKTDEIEELCDYNLDEDYPKTARDVLKLHNRYFNAFYSKDLEDEQIQKMNANTRKLYAAELCSYNTEDDMYLRLKSNIEEMDEKDCKYKSFVLPEASQIEYYTRNGDEMATAEVEISVSVDGDVGSIFMQYVLIKENDQWKILAWGESKLGNNKTE